MLPTTKVFSGMQYPNKDSKGTKIMPDVNGEPALSKDLCNAIAIAIFDGLRNKLYFAYERYQDEKKYEPIAGYAVMFEKTIESLGGTLVKMVAQPFGLVFKVDETHYQIKVTGKEYKVCVINAPVINLRSASGV